MKTTALLCSPLLLAASVALASDTLSYVDLVHRLTDLQRLALIPDSGERCAQWSSYDRASRYDEATGKYLRWDANGDGDGVIRKEGNQSVFAEMQGPGCIWRIWSATPKEGHVRIYLDGATEPAIDLPFLGYFDRKNEPFTRAGIIHTVANGWNNYTPIPYQKSCKVVADPGWGAYYHFSYSTFPEGTKVPTFTRQLGAADQAALDEAGRILTHCGPRPEESGPGSAMVEGTVTGEGGLYQGGFEGPSAITGIRFKPELPDGDSAYDFLRSVTLQIRWDGETEPSVWAPLGDFFGTAPGQNIYRSLPMGVTEDGWWYCNWFMPFAKKAEIVVRQEGKFRNPAKVHFTSKFFPDAARYARFHAKWHRDALLPAEPERKIDWPVLKTEGTGRFVGVMLHIWNPRGGWWGEGDEKFFVDGEKFPSTFGTGSEDYFGYAWSSAELFTHAYHNQTHNDGGSKGHVSVNRWQIAESVPFAKSFEGDIEKYYPNNKPTLYAAMAYWYLAPGGTDPYRAVPIGERLGYWTPIASFKVKGALEGERLKVIKRSAGNLEHQDMSGYSDGQWSGDSHLWWTGAKPGDQLELAIPVAKEGTYQLTAQLTKARDYGIVQLSLDGEKLGGPIDLYNPEVIPTGELALGSHALTAGEHKLTVEITGANPRAVKSYMFGLDYVKLAP